MGDDAPTTAPETAAPAAEAAPAAPAVEPPPAQETAKLQRIETLYDAGDFRSVDAEARELAERATDATVKERARTLHARVQIDPFVMWVWGGTTLLVFGIVYYFILR